MCSYQLIRPASTTGRTLWRRRQRAQDAGNAGNAQVSCAASRLPFSAMRISVKAGASRSRAVVRALSPSAEAPDEVG